MELKIAANLPVFGQDGQRYFLGELFDKQATCVVFIRHFLCPFCADYMRSIVREVPPEVLRKANVKLIVISHGSPYMIKSWKSIFNLPYEVYTDPSRKIHRALNMMIRTLSGGPRSERGDYLEHNLTLGLARVAKNAVTARMPLYRYPGDFFQVGGEFVFGPGLRCSYASRMHNTASHAPIREVVRAAGVD
ncbi:AhpC/TSA antioxidant enzyme-domain-containing protein, partial [Hysterangium stoloniferum]